MDVSLLSPGSIKIKTKRGNLVFDPNVLLKTKTEANAILLLTKNFKYSDQKLEGVRLVINGGGEYEIDGIKITGVGIDDSISYLIRVENLEVLIVKASLIKKIKENIKECHAIVINADDLVEQSSIIDFSPRMIAVYGEKGSEVANTLDGKGVNKIDKIQIIREKLPEEMGITLLE